MLPTPTDSLLLYQSEDGRIKIDVRFEGETVWLSLEQMAMLFGKAKATINYHVLNIYVEGELSEDITKRKIENLDFSTKPTNYYNLDVIIAVGYRVKSQQGTLFRQWATQRLREYIIKGFTLDDERMKSGSSYNYFKELLDRIREIRLSERVFYQQIKDIYATSIDYDPRMSQHCSFIRRCRISFSLLSVEGLRQSSFTTEPMLRFL